MVTRVYVAVEFHHPCMSASGSHGTHSRLSSHPVGQRRIKNLDKVFSHVIFYPFIEYGTEEISPLFGAYREIGQFFIFLQGVGQMSSVGMRMNPFYNRSKLNVPAAQFFEKMVKLQRIVSIIIIDYGHGIPFHLMLV